MSGIAGEIAVECRADADAVRRMSDKLASRGPDGEGTWVSDRVCFAHRRLAIIDTSETGAQPLTDTEVGLTVMMDGVVVNHHELRAELAATGYPFRTASDAEVVLAGYAAWGDQVAERLVGAYAIAVAEHDSGRVVLIRDRIGLKPLYIARTADAVRFASSLPALVAAGGIDTTLDPVALHHYMTFHAVVPEPRTILRGVAKVPPATVVTLNPDGTSGQRVYWSADYVRTSERADWTQEQWQDAVLDALRTGIERYMVADVPVGALLSGGVDSSLIVAMMVQGGMGDLKTFSIGFESFGGEQGDEFVYSDLVAAHFATDHHKIRIDTAGMLPALDEAIAAMSEPMVSHDAVAFYLLSREVSSHVTVVESGQGADEVFGGYHWYPPLADVADDDVEAALGAYRAAFFDRSRTQLETLLQPQWLHDPAVHADVATAFVQERFAAPGAQTAVDRALRMDTSVMAVDDPVKRVDNMTMAWGLEGRMPFLDHDLVELAATIPPHLKLAHGGKGVLKEAARKVIPHQVIDRPKGYFPVPALKHLQGPYLDKVTDAVTSRAARDRDLFNPAEIDAMLADPNGNLTPLRGNPLWQVALLHLWLDAHQIGGGL